MKLENDEVIHPIAAESQLPLVIGIDLGGTQLRVAVLRGATVIARTGLVISEKPSPDYIIPQMFQAVRQVSTEGGITLDQIAGIGIGAPGPLNGKTGIVFDPPNLPGWKDVPLRALFEEQFHIPIILENDANAAALGEYMFGAGHGSTELVYLTISTGIGGGVITGGRILAGVSGTAAELGHMTIDWHGGRCNCGNIGCLEYLASGTAIARQANEAIAMGKGDELLAFALVNHEQGKDIKQAIGVPFHVDTRTVALAAKAGIALASAIIAGAAEALGVGLVNIINIFNPETIILGGGVIQMGEILIAPAKHIVATRAMRIPREAMRIVLAELGNDAGLIGAGALVYQNG